MPEGYERDQARRGYDRQPELPTPRRRPGPGPIPAQGVTVPPPRGSARRRSPKPARPVPIVIVGRVLLSSVAAVVLLASGFTWYAYQDLTSGMHTSDAINVVKPGDQGYVAPHLDNSVNLLLIGLDSRKDMNGNDLPTQFVEDALHAGSSGIGGYNTNVLILMHIPANGGQVTAFSIPRDDYVEEPGGSSSVGAIPNLGMHKIKEAYGRARAVAESRLQAKGESGAKLEADSREVGRESTIRAVQLLTGVHIDHIAEINLLGFYDIAQAVGPIQVCLNHAVNDPIENGAGTGLRLPAGYSTLDAVTALQFVRQRFGLSGGDLDRNRRQQAFLSAVMHKLRGEGVIGDLGKMQSLFDVVKKDVVIDDNWDVLDFATKASNLTGGDAVFNELPITGQPILPGDGSVNTVNPAAIKSIVTSAFDNDTAIAPPTASSNSSTPTSTAPTTTAPPPNAVVDIYNATNRTGLAGAAAQILNAGGIPVDKTGNAPNQSHTTVLYGSGEADAARQLAAKLGITAVPAAGNQVVSGRVQIYLGADYTLPGSSAPPVGTTSVSGATTGPAGGSTSSSGINMGNGITCVN